MDSGYGFFEELEKYSGQNSIDILKKVGFDKSNLVWFWSDSHLFYRFRGDMPITRPYLVDYIGGVCNDHYDLDKAETILKKNRWASQIEKIDIPYYNADTSQEAVQFVLRLFGQTHQTRY